MSRPPICSTSGQETRSPPQTRRRPMTARAQTPLFHTLFVVFSASNGRCVTNGPGCRLTSEVMGKFKKLLKRKRVQNMSRRNNLSHRLGFESLEGRQLMAVVASVNIEGDLVVTGDGQADQVAIVQVVQNGVPVAGRYFVAPQNGTLLNGQAAGRFFNNVIDDIRVNLGGNNDRLTLGNGNNGQFIVPD